MNTGEPIALEDVAGDHNIPRSWGVVKPINVTEYHNLRVTSRTNNRRKSDKSGEQFMKILEEENSGRKSPNQFGVSGHPHFQLDISFLL